MDIKRIVQSQYQAALSMLAQTIEKCPEDVWLDTAVSSPFWQVAYHVLFYTHLYLQPAESDFTPWEHQRGEAQYLGKRPWAPDEEPNVAMPYSKDEILAYLAFCREQVRRQVPGLTLDGESGFYWLPFSKLELQLYNIRHVQSHAGELAERLGQRGIAVEWVGAASSG